MTSFSVKKPFTVFVAVVAILVFGVMSYVKMTPDLMPNMDYPYVVVVTTYPGAAPEEVEAVVTKPMEQSMATLNDIKTVTSTSAENYSMLVLEFEQSTNMDSAVVDILQKTQMLTGRWDDSIGTPSIIRINPNMIPVMVAAVDSSEMDRYELSRFAKDTVIPTLEGTTGVASITTGGMIERTMTIEVNEAKLDKMNAKIAEAIDKAMEDARRSWTRTARRSRPARTSFSAHRAASPIPSSRARTISPTRSPPPERPRRSSPPRAPPSTRSTPSSSRRRPRSRRPRRVWPKPTRASPRWKRTARFMPKRSASPTTPWTPPRRWRPPDWTRTPLPRSTPRAVPISSASAR